MNPKDCKGFARVTKCLKGFQKQGRRAYHDAHSIILTIVDHFEPFGTIWDHLRSFLTNAVHLEIFWIQLRPFQTISDYINPFRTI